MSIRKRTRQDGSTYYFLDERTGYTMDGKADRVQKRFATLKQAKLEQARIIAERDALRNRSGRIEFGSYVRNWYLPTTSRLAKSSRDTYERELRLRLFPAFDHVDVRDIDRARIQRMVSGCQSEAVAKKALGLLRTILNAAVSDRLIAVNPACSKFTMPEPGRKRGSQEVVSTFAAMRPLFDAVDAIGDECVELLAVTGLLCGLRPEERYGLDWSDFDFSHRTITISRAYTAVSAREGSNDLKAPKTEYSRRTIPVSAEAARRIQAYARRGNVVRVGAMIEGAGHRRISPSTAQKRWSRFLEKCDKEGYDVPHVTLENMRHSFATSFLHAGGNVEDLSRILGHSDINTTYRRYVKPNVDDLRRGMDAVDRIMAQG